MDTKSKAESYYKALSGKNIEEVAKYLHPDIEFIDPQERVLGKGAVLKAAEGFMGMFSSLTIKASFGSESQAMVVYEVEIPAFHTKIRAASLLKFEKELIIKIELIYDLSCFSSKNG